MKIKTTRLIAVFLAIIMILSMLPVSSFAAEADMTISTYEQLKEFADSVNGGNTYEGKRIRLEVNVFLGGKSNPWISIGTSSKPFKGTFDGNYHVISGLYIASGSSVGFFGYVNGGTVKNLIVDGTVNASNNTAAVVGYLNAGTVQNCGSRATVSGGSGVGGVVGYGGGNFTVSNCYNLGNISGATGYVGGVAGWTYGSGTVENCYNIGLITGPATVGGVAGGYKGGSAKLTNCYNAGKIVDSMGNKNNIGAVVGVTRGSVSNCHYLKDSGPNNYNYIEAASASDFDLDLLGSAFTFGASYPALIWESSVSTDAPVRAAYVEKTELAAKLADYIRAAVGSTKSHFGLSYADTLLGNPEYLKGVSSTETDWMALAMGRFGYFDSSDGEYCYRMDEGTGYADYLAAMKAYIEKMYKEGGGILHSVKATEWHRAVVAIAALGGDPTAFGIYNGRPINLIADGSYNSVLRQGPGTQGINGWIWGLIALDAGSYAVPTDAKYSREKFITEILKMQLTDGVNGNEYGGWVLGGYGSKSDVDITSMAIQALAPYYNEETVYIYTNSNSKKEVCKTVRQCVDEALDRLGSMMDANGSFSSWSTNNAEGVSQVVVALCALGIDPAKDSRFITASGKTLLDGMLAFRLPDGGFCHVLGGGWNSMATDQATYALVSYWRLENEMRALYDMRSDWTKEEKTAIDTAIEVISNLPEPSAENYKTSLKAALAAFRAVPEKERRYVSNYALLSSAIELVGGEAALDTDAPYIVSISVAKNPDKVNYFEGETFDSTGMIVTAVFSDESQKELIEYKYAPSNALTLEDNTIYISYLGPKTSVKITVEEKLPWEGEGTEENPYLIGNADELVSLAERVNAGKSTAGKTYALTSHIDLSGIDNWKPIGTSRNRCFDGTFDGHGYVIDNLCCASGGLFGYVGANAVIQNVGVAGGEIGRAGNNISFLGGIAGWSDGADFINCWNGADIYAGGYSGGIVGTVRDGGESLIKGCYNVGSIYGKSTALGGIAGHLDTTRSQSGTATEVTIEDCYNTGYISGTNSIGGIVGFMQDGHTLRSCYNVGEISADMENQVGAIAGTVTPGNVFENCYYNSEISDSGLGRGMENEEVIAMASDEMRSEEFLALLGESFTEDPYGLANNGYPLLYWQRTYDADDIDEVIEKIGAIGTVTLDSADAINAARNAYDNLDDELKQYVSNYAVLEQAEKTLAEMQTLQQAKEAARKVSEQIAEIGTVTLESEDAILAARSAYNALSDEAKAFVANYYVLTNAESELARLKGELDTESPEDNTEPPENNNKPSNENDPTDKNEPSDGEVLTDENEPSDNDPTESETTLDNNDPADGNSDNTPETSPNTGDITVLPLYISLMVISLFGFIILTRTRKKEM